MKMLAMGLVPLLLSGCFTYVPVDLGVLPVGGRVRVQLEERRDATFRPPSGSARLSGILVRESPTEVVLRVPLAPRQRLRTGAYYTHQRDHAGRDPSTGRQAMAIMGAGALGATAGVLAFIARPGGRISPGEGPNTDNDESFTGGFGRTVIFSIPLW